jgi:uncharacterized protein YndB with AHSA1/START domain
MTSVTLVRRIAARPELVFDAMTDAEQLPCWWGPDDGPVLFAESDVRVGGSFRVRFRMLDGYECESMGQYLEVVRPERIVMSWTWSDGGETEEHGEESRIEIALRPIDIGTELTFTHARLKNEKSRASHEEGWNGALDKLVRHFERQRQGETA